MPMYTIKVDYHTGDSFNSYDTDTTLSGKWELDVAKENLRRIKAHYKAYSNKNNYYSMSMHEEGSKVEEDISNEPWYREGKYQGAWEHTIVLTDNEGSRVEHSCPWIGYFERLIGASIVADEDEENDMAFTV